MSKKINAFEEVEIFEKLEESEKLKKFKELITNNDAKGVLNLLKAGKIQPDWLKDETIDINNFDFSSEICNRSYGTVNFTAYILNTYSSYNREEDSFKVQFAENLINRNDFNPYGHYIYYSEDKSFYLDDILKYPKELNISQKYFAKFDNVEMLQSCLSMFNQFNIAKVLDRVQYEEVRQAVISSLEEMIDTKETESIVRHLDYNNFDWSTQLSDGSFAIEHLLKKDVDGVETAFHKLNKSVDMFKIAEMIYADHSLTKPYWGELLQRDYSFNKPLSNGVTLLQNLIADAEIDLRHVKNFLDNLLDRNLSTLNINALSNEGKRAIDYCRSIDAVQMLRDYGSVEPINLVENESNIKLVLFPGVEPDSNPINKENICKLLIKLRNEYSLNEDDINSLITTFINKHELEQITASWANNEAYNVYEVINQLSRMTYVTDRIVNSVSGEYFSWSFKEVLGSILFIVQNNSELESKLINTLSQISMCNLSKLMHLIYVIQDQIVDVNTIDYNNIDFEYFRSLNDKLVEYFSNNNDMNIDFVKWLNEYIAKIKPEDWSSSTQLINKVLNSYFKDLFNDAELIQSYHYTHGLKMFTDILANLLKPEINLCNTTAKKWQTVIEEGERSLIIKYFNKVLDYIENDKNLTLKEAFKDLDEVNYGNFKNFSLQNLKTILDYINKVFGVDGVKFLLDKFEYIVIIEEIELFIKDIREEVNNGFAPDHLFENREREVNDEFENGESNQNFDYETNTSLTGSLNNYSDTVD